MVMLPEEECILDFIAKVLNVPKSKIKRDKKMIFYIKGDLDTIFLELELEEFYHLPDISIEGDMLISEIIQLVLDTLKYR